MRRPARTMSVTRHVKTLLTTDVVEDAPERDRLTASVDLSRH